MWQKTKALGNGLCIRPHREILYKHAQPASRKEVQSKSSLYPEHVILGFILEAILEYRTTFERPP